MGQPEPLPLKRSVQITENRENNRGETKGQRKINRPSREEGEDKLRKKNKNYIEQKKRLQLSKHSRSVAERARLAQSRRSVEHRLTTISLESSRSLNTLEFLHFQTFHKIQVIMVERILWLGITDPRKGVDQSRSMEGTEDESTPSRHQKL